MVRPRAAADADIVDAEGLSLYGKVRHFEPRSLERIETNGKGPAPVSIPQCGEGRCLRGRAVGHGEGGEVAADVRCDLFEKR